MNKKLSMIAFWTAAICLAFQTNQDETQQIRPTSAKEMQESVKKHQEMLENSPYRDYPARNVGPTNMSGRIVDIEISSDFKTYYVAAASGGVWKTMDNGQSFTPIF
jgi:hypothetical protein